MPPIRPLPPPFPGYHSKSHASIRAGEQLATPLAMLAEAVCVGAEMASFRSGPFLKNRIPSSHPTGCDPSLLRAGKLQRGLRQPSQNRRLDRAPTRASALRGDRAHRVN